MYEVECPDCRHRFDVGEEEALVRCPSCNLELELVVSQPTDEKGLEPLPELPGESYNESPCPFCGGSLLVSESDESGLCAHCKRPLLFDKGRALVDVAAQEGEGKPSATQKSGGPVETPPAKKSQAPNPAGAGAPFDPDLAVTPANAPMVEFENLPEPAPPEGGQEPSGAVPEQESSGARTPAKGATGASSGSVKKSGSRTSHTDRKKATKRGSSRTSDKKAAKQVSKGGKSGSARKSTSGKKPAQRGKSGAKKGSSRKRGGSRGANR